MKEIKGLKVNLQRPAAAYPLRDKDVGGAFLHALILGTSVVAGSHTWSDSLLGSDSGAIIHVQFFSALVLAGSESASTVD